MEGGLIKASAGFRRPQPKKPVMPPRPPMQQPNGHHPIEGNGGNRENMQMPRTIHLPRITRIGMDETPADRHCRSVSVAFCKTNRRKRVRTTRIGPRSTKRLSVPITAQGDRICCNPSGWARLAELRRATVEVERRRRERCAPTRREPESRETPA